MKHKKTVSIIIGSESDRPIAEAAVKVLRELGIPHEVKVLSAHRTPRQLESYLKGSQASVYIAIAGLAAHLPGFIASRTTNPVIGVPVSVKLHGIDALLSMAQMPPGVPVATVGVDNGKNAALLAARILSLSNKTLARKLKEYMSSS
jgi:5-(carboxyamino)imidazole ribonucleotide mutase